jgi:hypothetical protein
MRARASSLVLLAVAASASLTATCVRPHAELRPFTTDRCSLAPDGPVLGDGPGWAACCVAHDRRYWRGGSSEERRAADTEFRHCLDAVPTRLAPVMELAVRVFGTPYLPTRFRWSYGWPYTRGYRPLSEEEARRARELLPDADPPEPLEPVRTDAHEGASGASHALDDSQRFR